MFDNKIFWLWIIVDIDTNFGNAWKTKITKKYNINYINIFLTIYRNEPTTHIIVKLFSNNNFSKSHLGFEKWTFLKMSKNDFLKFFSEN